MLRLSEGLLCSGPHADSGQGAGGQDSSCQTFPLRTKVGRSWRVGGDLGGRKLRGKVHCTRIQRIQVSVPAVSPAVSPGQVTSPLWMGLSCCLCKGEDCSTPLPSLTPSFLGLTTQIPTAMLSKTRQCGLPGDIWKCHNSVALREMEYCFWHLVGRGQGCYQTSKNTQDSSPQKRLIWPKRLIVPRLKNTNWKDNIMKNSFGPIIVLFPDFLFVWFFLRESEHLNFM